MRKKEEKGAQKILQSKDVRLKGGRYTARVRGKAAGPSNSPHVRSVFTYAIRYTS